MGMEQFNVFIPSAVCTIGVDGLVAVLAMGILRGAAAVRSRYDLCLTNLFIPYIFFFDHC